MAELRKSAAIATDRRLSVLIDRCDQFLLELTPRNAIVVWDLLADVPSVTSGATVGPPTNDQPQVPSDAPWPDHTSSNILLRLSDAFGQSECVLSPEDLDDIDGMIAELQRLVGDLVYQKADGLSDPNRLQHLGSFLPGRLLSRFERDSSVIPLPYADNTLAAVLFADISGFTALTEKLAARGPVGAEELTAALNDYFGRLIEIVAAHGGHVVKFAGDALLATFDADQFGAADSGEPDTALRSACLAAVEASLQMQASLADFPKVHGTQLSLKIALSAGDLRQMHLGGIFGRCEMLLVSEAITELGHANDCAKPGDVIASESLWRQVSDCCAGVRIDDHATRLLPGSCEITTGHSATDSATGSATPMTLPHRSVLAMRGYVPAAIFSRLAAGQTDWLGELRRITVVFANIPGFSPDVDIDDAQRLMKTLQRAVYDYEGSLNKLSIDDKGVSMLAAFGLPPVAHEDDAQRAVSCAMALRKAFEQRGWKCSIGVATGRVFCGAYGNNRRREYTVIGDTVNLSARLMQAARGGILCDQTTRDTACGRFEFDPLPPMTMKGKAQPVACFVPVERRHTVTASRAVETVNVIGRQEERQRFQQRLDGFVDRAEPALVLLQGEAGIGKSHLLSAFRQQCLTRGARIVTGRADAIERSTPYFAWRDVFSAVIGLDEESSTAPGESVDAEFVENLIRQRFKFNEELLQILPLLRSVLPVQWADNARTAQMSGPVRADNTNVLLVQLLRQAARDEHLVIVLEDLHWFDSASWTLLRDVVDHVQPALILGAMRPMPEPLPRVLETLFDRYSPLHLPLDVLCPGDAVLLARHRLEVEQLPAAVEELIRQRTQGHPLYVEEMAYTLRESGILRITEGVATITGDLELFASQAASESIDGIIVNRIDRLDPSQQLTLKVASVIGYEFPYPVLQNVFPILDERQQLIAHLDSLDQMKLVHAVDGRADVEWTFHHRMIRDVAYHLVLHRQRTELHRRVAEWLMANTRGDVAASWPLLAEHWLLGGNVELAIDCFEKAGEHALETNANLEAGRFFRRVIELFTQQSCAGEPPHRCSLSESDEFRVAVWHSRLGEAQYRLGEIGDSKVNLRTALRMLGYPDAESAAGAMLKATGEVVRHFGRRLLRWRRASHTEGRGPAMIEAVRAYERLVEIQYQSTNMPGLMYGAFRALNLAEKYGCCPELARSYSHSAAITSVMCLPGVAEDFNQRAIATAAEVGDLTTTAYVDTINSVHWLGMGHWQAAQDTLRRAVKECADIGDRRRWCEASALLTNATVWSGDWDTALTMAGNLMRYGAQEQIGQVAIWGLAWFLWCESTIDPCSDALRDAEVEARRWCYADDPLPLADRLLGLGGLLAVSLRRGDWKQALAHADEIEQALKGMVPVAVYLLPTYLAMADFYFAMCQSEASEFADLRRMRRRLRMTHLRVLSFSIMCPMARPLRLLCKGRWHEVMGRRGKAQRWYSAAVTDADQRGMPYAAALAELRLSIVCSDAHEKAAWRESADQRLAAHGIQDSGCLQHHPPGRLP